MKAIDLILRIYETASDEAKEYGFSAIPEETRAMELSNEEALHMLFLITKDLQTVVDDLDMFLEFDWRLDRSLSHKSYCDYLASANKLYQELSTPQCPLRGIHLSNKELK